MSSFKSTTSSSLFTGDHPTHVSFMDSQGIDLKRQSLNQHVEHVRRMSIEVAQGTSTWSRHTAAAVDAVTFFTLHPAFETALSRSDRIEVTRTLQQVAYHKSSGEPISLVADWCASEWLRLCEEQSDDIDALYGLALSWLHRSQAVLYKIYELARRSSSSSSASIRSYDRERRSLDNNSITHSLSGNSEDNEAKVNSADYVEARTSLQPATEYFDRAINAATAQQRKLGEELLARVSTTARIDWTCS